MEEVFSTFIMISCIIIFIITAFLISKIPGAGIVFGLLRRLFLLLWGLFRMFLMFIMFFMVGYMAVILLTFTQHEKGLLFRGEPIHVFIGDQAEHAVYFILLYSLFALVSTFVLFFLLGTLRRFHHFGSKFDEEIILLLMLGITIKGFPLFVHAVLPDFTVGTYGAYALGILPLAFYVQGQIDKARKGSRNWRYQTTKERFYSKLDRDNHGSRTSTSNNGRMRRKRSVR